MDSGPGPPQQSPDDYSAREKKERTVVAVGITIGVLVLFAGPLCLLWYAHWRRKRRIKQQEIRDLEGTTAVSTNEKYGTNPFTRTGASTLTTTLAAEEVLDVQVAQRELQQGRTETELERLKRDPTSPLNTLPKHTEQPTPEEVLGLDKKAYLRTLPPGNRSSPSSDALPEITVLQSRVPSEPFDSEGESSKQTEEQSDDGKFISPWAVEHEPNPVIFKHLLGPRDEKPGHGEACIQQGEPSHQSHASPGSSVSSEALPHWDEGMRRYPQINEMVTEGERSRESSAMEDTSGSSPSYSTSSHDSSQPLLSEGSAKDSSESPVLSLKVPHHHQGRTLDFSSSQQTAETTTGLLCTHCNRTFTTTGQLNAHMHRKHIRRYSCALCASTFHLKTDLKRHELTVHRKDLAADTRGFRCPNPACAIPEKVFLRRDNFERHVSRCTRRKEEGEGQKVGG